MSARRAARPGPRCSKTWAGCARSVRRPRSTACVATRVIATDWWRPTYPSMSTARPRPSTPSCAVTPGLRPKGCAIMKRGGWSDIAGDSSETARALGRRRRRRHRRLARRELLRSPLRAPARGPAVFVRPRDLWRIAVQYPGCPVPACIHRAPKTHRAGRHACCSSVEPAKRGDP